MRKIISIGVVVLGVFFYIGIAQAEDAGKITKKIEETYKNINSFQADFTMEQRSGGKKLEGKGKIWWKKEGKFKTEMDMVTPISGEKGKTEEMSTKQKQTIVFDGKVFWVYSNTNNQSQVMRLDSTKLDELSDSDPIKKQGENLMGQLEEAPSSLFSPNSFIKKEVEEVSEKKWEGEDFYVLKEKQTEVWVKKENYLMYRIITRDEESNIVSHIEFSNIKVNKDIPDELFTFEVPEGVQVIDIMDMLKGMYKEPEKKEIK